MFAVRWNAGVNNYMTYITGDIPVGLYQSSNLANMGLGHGAIDGGVGYTYFDPKTGHEFSVVTGLTGNFENTSTNYTSGIDWHIDWGASQFLTKQVQVGLVGYVYDQISPDRGCAPQPCPFESRVAGIGPQFGYIFPISPTLQGYINLKAYAEFDHANRPDGWNAWVTFVISPAALTPAPPALVTKAPRLQGINPTSRMSAVGSVSNIVDRSVHTSTADVRVSGRKRRQGPTRDISRPLTVRSWATAEAMGYAIRYGLFGTC
jgi:hypothetical protein